MKKINIAVTAVFGLILFFGIAMPGLAQDYDVLVGSYRVLWTDGSHNDHIFKIERIGNAWFMSADGEERHRLWKYDVEYRIEEDFPERLNNENLLDTPCLDSGGASRIRVCAIRPGETLRWHGKELTVSTGYFLYDGDYLFFQLEKLH